MTRKQLQDALRPFKADNPQIKLNAKTEQLQAWWNEVNGQQELDLEAVTNDSSGVEQPELNGQSTELTCAVRLPKVLDLQWFKDNYSCEIPSSSNGTSATPPQPQESYYWNQWQQSYNKALNRLKKPALPSFAATVLTIASIFLDCFASMYKAITKTVTKRRKKAVGFGV